MRGHGWVIPIVDGAVARCGGPGLCSQCALEARALEIWRRNEAASGARLQRIYPNDADRANGAWARAVKLAQMAGERV